jgi:hypothetical protein
MGQSLVLMPFDAIASTIAKPPLRRLRMSVEKQRQAAEVIMAFLMQSFLASAAVVLAYGLLRTFEFSCFVSSAGALSLLFGTTCLTYVQNAQENLLLLSLALASLCCLRQWRKGGGVAWCAAAGAACGFALLVRLTSCMEIAVFGALGCLWGTNARLFLTGFASPLIAAGLLERWYQWRRFGGWFTTYAGFAAKSLGTTDLIFSHPFWQGFWGTLGSPDKSVLLFDPLLLILVAIAAWRWRLIAKDLRMLLVSLAILYLVYSSFYARSYSFGGDVAWGHRYVSLPVQLLALFAVPLLLTHRRTLWPSWRAAGWALVVGSVALQLLSTVMAVNVEVMQRERGFRQGGVVWNRIVNVAQLAAGVQDPRRFVGIPIEWRGLSYFPFQLRLRFPGLATWAIAGWKALLICLPILAVLTLNCARNLDGRQRV